jgi:hypothetical protein
MMSPAAPSLRSRLLGAARARAFVVAVAAFVASAGALLAPLALAADPKPVALASDGGADAGGDAGADAGKIGISRIPPDPTPMAERKQWVFDLKYDKGEIFLLGVHRVDLPAPQPTARAMGRFAIELFEGPTLIERVRFDFPFLGAGETSDGGYKAPPKFEPKLVTRIGVVFPATPRGTRLELWDRATDRRWPLPWPPEDTRAPQPPQPPADGG